MTWIQEIEWNQQLRLDLKTNKTFILPIEFWADLTETPSIAWRACASVSLLPVSSPHLSSQLRDERRSTAVQRSRRNRASRTENSTRKTEHGGHHIANGHGVQSNGDDRIARRWERELACARDSRSTISTRRGTGEHPDVQRECQTTTPTQKSAARTHLSVSRRKPSLRFGERRQNDAHEKSSRTVGYASGRHARRRKNDPKTNSPSPKRCRVLERKKRKRHCLCFFSLAWTSIRCIRRANSRTVSTMAALLFHLSLRRRRRHRRRRRRFRRRIPSIWRKKPSNTPLAKASPNRCTRAKANRSRRNSRRGSTTCCVIVALVAIAAAEAAAVAVRTIRWTRGVPSTFGATRNSYSTRYRRAKKTNTSAPTTWVKR